MIVFYYQTTIQKKIVIELIRTYYFLYIYIYIFSIALTSE